MTVNQNATETRSSSKLLIKQTARRLFAERGVHDISVREIAQTARQKNLGVVAYYFGTKDNLIREILIDGAERIEARRNTYLSLLESENGPQTVEEAVSAIVLPSARFGDEDAEYGSLFNRYIYQLSLTHSAFIDRTLEGRWNEGYQRCLKHLRRLLPHLNRPQQNRRFVFMQAYVSALLAQRELMIADTSKRHLTWQSNETLNDIVRTAAALLQAD